MNMKELKRNCLKEILDVVTAKDEKTFLVSVEYVKNYKGTVLGKVHKYGYGNCAEIFLIKNKFKQDVNNEWTWNSFNEAKKKIKKIGESSQRVFHLKKGLKIAFKYHMFLDYNFDEIITPKWFALYNEWFESFQATKSS